MSRAPHDRSAETGAGSGWAAGCLARPETLCQLRAGTVEIGGLAMFGPERASQPRLVRRGLHERTCLSRMRRFVCYDVCRRCCDLVELGWSRAEQAPRLHLGGGPALDMP